jgi:hypothetical protein
MNNGFAMHVNELLPILQAAIGPVILISGVGLLLLSMTNRYGRIIDRARAMAEALREATPDHRERISSQLQVLHKRARMARSAISLATISVLLAAVLVIVLFVTAFLQLNIALLCVAVFIACLLSLIASLLFLLGEINLSLAALRLEIESLR